MRKYRHYSAEELQFLEANKTMPRKELHAKFVKRFNRPDVSLNALRKLCKRKGWYTGRTGCFSKGHIPHTWKPVGYERLTKDGYVRISVKETDPRTGFKRCQALKHRWLWQKEHGPIPEGMALKCLDGNKQNTDPSNWKLIPQTMIPRLNGRFGRGYDQADPELKPVIMAVTELEYTASQRMKTRHDGTDHTHPKVSDPADKGG